MERSPRVAIVPVVAKVMVSRHVQAHVYQRSIGTQTSLLRAPRMLGAVVQDWWVLRKIKVIEKFIPDNVVGGSSWMNGGDGSRHVHAILSNLFKKHPMLISGVVFDIGHTHKAFKVL